MVYNRDMDIFTKIASLPPNTLAVVSVVVLIWTLPWKGVALWKAARLSHKKWFIALLVLNTFAILEIIYIFHVARAAEEAGNVEDSNEAELKR